MRNALTSGASSALRIRVGDLGKRRRVLIYLSTDAVISSKDFDVRLAINKDLGQVHSTCDMIIELVRLVHLMTFQKKDSIL